MADTVPKPQNHLKSKSKVRRGFRYALYSLIATALIGAPILCAPETAADPNVVSVFEVLSPEGDYITTIEEAAHAVFRLNMTYHFTRTVVTYVPKPLPPDAKPGTPKEWERREHVVPGDFTTRGSGTVVSCQMVEPPVFEYSLDEAGEMIETMVKRPVYRIILLSAEHVTAFMVPPPDVTLTDVQVNVMNRTGNIIADDFAVIYENPDEDISLVSFLSDTPYKAVKLADAAPGLGERIFVIGYGGNRGAQWISDGIYSGDDRITSPVSPGDSGGAILSSSFEIIGVASAMEVARNPWSPFPEAVSHHAYMAPTITEQNMQILIDELLKAQYTKHPEEGFYTPPTPPSDSEETDTDSTTENKSPHEPSQSTGPTPEEPKAPSKDRIGPLGPEFED